MRTVEHSLSPESFALAQESLADATPSNDVPWTETVDLGDGVHVVDIKVCAGGEDSDPYVDAVLFEKDEAGMLHEVQALDVGDDVHGEFVFDSIGVTLVVSKPPSLTP